MTFVRLLGSDVLETSVICEGGAHLLCFSVLPSSTLFGVRYIWSQSFLPAGLARGVNSATRVSNTNSLFC